MTPSFQQSAAPGDGDVKSSALGDSGLPPQSFQGQHP